MIAGSVVFMLTHPCMAVSAPQEAVIAELGDKRWGDFKPLLTDAVVAHLEPIQARYAEVRAEPGYLDEVLLRGAEEASRTANWTLDNCRDAMGFMPCRR